MYWRTISVPPALAFASAVAFTHAGTCSVHALGGATCNFGVRGAVPGPGGDSRQTATFGNDVFSRQLDQPLGARDRNST